MCHDETTTPGLRLHLPALLVRLRQARHPTRGRGSRDYRSCDKPPLPVLRSEFDREVADVAGVVRDRYRL